MPVDSMIEEKPNCDVCHTERVSYSLREVGIKGASYSCKRHLVIIIDEGLRPWIVRKL